LFQIVKSALNCNCSRETGCDRRQDICKWRYLLARPATTLANEGEDDEKIGGIRDDEGNEVVEDGEGIKR